MISPCSACTIKEVKNHEIVYRRPAIRGDAGVCHPDPSSHEEAGRKGKVCTIRQPAPDPGISGRGARCRPGEGGHVLRRLETL